MGGSLAARETPVAPAGFTKACQSDAPDRVAPLRE